mmetsp:Transcript_27581/g.83974  ORF Transcript_27581/g.83974 Transcript_27581/m.83974 type:complete len:585 (+) Transcript_27581:2-1756(+)
MWDDMLASDIFKVTPVFLCSSEHHRPCTRSASVGVQLQYSFMLVVVCAIIKAYVESFYARHNRGSLIIPGMLGMLVGWSFGRSFQGLRHMLEAYFLGCERWGPPTHVTTNDFDLSYIFSGQSKAESRAATNDCLECEVIAPSEMTTRFRMLYALLVTLCSSFIILLLEPAAALETFGSSSWRRTIGIEVKSLVQLLSKAAATTSMILWNDALTGGATKGIEDDQEDVRIRMLLFYSMAMTFGGSAVSIQFQSWSRHLTALAEEAARAAAEAASKKREVALRMDDQMRKLSETEGDAGGTAALAESSVQSFSEAQQPGEKVNCQPIGVDILPRSRSAASLSGLIKMGGDNAAGVARSLKAQTRRTRRLLETMGANITALRIRVHFIAASLRMLAVLEATLGWVTGCAWTDYTIAVYPTIGAFPSDWWILLDNVKIAILLSVLAIAWITFTGNSSVGASGERETRERLFIGGAFSFFSGWAWISVVRCIWVLPYALLPESGTAPFGVDGPVDWQYVIELLLSLVFCPIATWLVILAALSTKNAYEKRAGISLWKRHVNAIRAFTRARAEINRKLRMAPSRLPDVLL